MECLGRGSRHRGKPARQFHWQRLTLLAWCPLSERPQRPGANTESVLDRADKNAAFGSRIGQAMAEYWVGVLDMPRHRKSGCACQGSPVAPAQSHRGIRPWNE